MEKSFSADSTTVNYSIDYTYFSAWNYGYPDFNLDTVYYQDTVIFSYNFDDSTYLSDLPYELSSLTNSFQKSVMHIDFFYYDHAYYGKTFPHFYYYLGNDSCLNILSGTLIYSDITYIPGLGEVLIYDYEDQTSNTIRSLVYFKKGNVEWGTPVNFSNWLSSENLNFQKEFAVFPNPTSGKLFLHPKENSINNIQITVKNQLGENVKTIWMNPNLKNEIDIFELPAGVYFLLSSDEKNSFSSKIIKL